MTAPEPGNGREYPRYAHEAVITLHTPELAISGRTSNVSRGGLCATLSEEISIGTQIDLDIQLVFSDEAQSEPLRVPARVVWCTSVDEGHQVGISFMPMDHERAEYLTMFLRYLEDDGSDDGEADDKADAAAPNKPPVDDRFD